MKSTTLTASEARSNFYNLIRSASLGITEHVIKLQGADPVILVNQDDYESLKETAEILSIPQALTSIKQGTNEAKMGLGRQLVDNI